MKIADGLVLVMIGLKALATVGHFWAKQPAKAIYFAGATILTIGILLMKG